MNKRIDISKGKSWGISWMLGLAVWGFFAVFYRHHLHYQEQMQLFLDTSDFLREQAALPGGLAGYLSSFLIQFFYNSTLGALLIALLLVALQWLVLDAAHYVTPKPGYELLTCLPSLGYVLLLCNEDFLLSGLIALLFALGAMAVYNRVEMFAVRTVFLLLLIPMFYWLVGFGSVVFPVLALSTEWLRREREEVNKLLAVTGVSLLLSVAMPLIAKAVVLQYPLVDFLLAGRYARFAGLLHTHYLCVILSVVLVPVLFRWLPDEPDRKKRRLYTIGQFLFVSSFTFAGLTAMADWDKEEVMAYDYYSRMQKWEQIIARADRKAPQGPLTVATLNLALNRSGYMPDYMFTYFQNGPEGLLPSFQKDFIVPTMTGEIYYHLGLINTAQHFAFEAMETIPDFKKSIRAIKRLAETNLINGQYAVAAKYLRILQHTFTYKKWATETLGYLGDEDRINAHPEWGHLRKFRPREDFLFSESEKDQMTGILFQQEPTNHMAYEYLLAYTLLNKDLSHFLQYYGMGEGKLTYRVLPKSYQEALALIWSTGGTRQEAPPQIEKEVIERLHAFQTLQKNPGNAEAILKDQFGDTYWYYFYYRR